MRVAFTPVRTVTQHVAQGLAPGASASHATKHRRNRWQVVLSVLFALALFTSQTANAIHAVEHALDSAHEITHDCSVFQNLSAVDTHNSIDLPVVHNAVPQTLSANDSVDTYPPNYFCIRAPPRV